MSQCVKSEDMEKLLPIGSVVRLKKNVTDKLSHWNQIEQQGKFMIEGQIVRDSGVNYDYIAVEYPYGYIGEREQVLFNHNDIQDVLFVGYDSEERQDFIEQLKCCAKKEESKKDKKRSGLVRRVLGLCLAVGMLTGLTGCGHRAETNMNELGQDQTVMTETNMRTLLTEDEKAMLLSFYDSLPLSGKLTSRQQELVTEYRYLRTYLLSEHPGLSFNSPQLQPAGFLLGGGPDAFYLTCMSDGNEYKFEVDMSDDNSCEIRYDGYSTNSTFGAN